MAAQTMDGTKPVIHKTLSTTVADLITISGVGVTQARVVNRDAAQALWVKRLNLSTDAAIAASGDGAIFVPANDSKLVDLSYDPTSGASYLSIVGSANGYSVQLVPRDRSTDIR